MPVIDEDQTKLMHMRSVFSIIYSLKNETHSKACLLLE